ncbi:TRMT1-like protein [Cichlidogyrus casuarinus]|uniref:TRMT1-like protein n=1 Tax=Cichlidogyrus casuarinus TaxID=1844966 RepID=A0ABD2QPN2_9PLAT
MIKFVLFDKKSSIPIPDVSLSEEPNTAPKAVPAKKPSKYLTLLKRELDSRPKERKQHSEFGILIDGVHGELGRPASTKPYFNPKMRSNRAFVLSSLATLLHLSNPDRIIDCLDAFSATGVMALQWLKLQDSARLNVFACEFDQESYQFIRDKSCPLNSITIDTLSQFELTQTAPKTIQLDIAYVPTLKLLQADCNAVMHSASFDFMYVSSRF